MDPADAIQVLGENTNRPRRKSHLAARILFRKEAGCMNAGDRRLARILAQNPEATNRLIQQPAIRSDTTGAASKIPKQTSV